MRLVALLKFLRRCHLFFLYPLAVLNLYIAEQLLKTNSTGNWLSTRDASKGGAWWIHGNDHKSGKALTDGPLDLKAAPGWIRLLPRAARHGVDAGLQCPMCSDQ